MSEKMTDQASAPEQGVALTEGERASLRRLCDDGRQFDEVAARRNGKTIRLIEQFNEVCPIGTPVLYWPGAREGEGRKSVTRSAAWLLGGHTPVVMVEGYAGGIALSHVMGYQPAEVTP